MGESRFGAYKMQEVVLDTNVLVAALRSKRGASYQLIRSIGQGNWRPNISVALALEYEDVLKRKGLLPITDAETDDFLDYVFKASRLVPSVLRRRPSATELAGPGRRAYSGSGGRVPRDDCYVQ